MTVWTGELVTACNPPQMAVMVAGEVKLILAPADMTTPRVDTIIVSGMTVVAVHGLPPGASGILFPAPLPDGARVLAYVSIPRATAVITSAHITLGDDPPEWRWSS